MLPDERPSEGLDARMEEPEDEDTSGVGLRKSTSCEGFILKS